jgi:bifunctional DNase/RNase
MILMQVREIIYCPHHKQGIVVLESVREHLPLVFYAEVKEAQHLAKTLKSGHPPAHPLYEFIRRLLRSFQAATSFVVLDEVTGQGVQGFVYVQGRKTRHSIPCYAPNALALALQAKIPIYATTRTLAHAEPAAPSPKTADEEHMRQWLAQVKPEDFQRPAADGSP